MCKPDHNQDPPQQCGLHHLGYIYVRVHTQLLLQHPRGRFLIHKTPTQHVPPRDFTAVQPKVDSGRICLRLHGYQENNGGTQKGQETSQRPSYQEPGQKWIYNGTTHTVPLAPPHVRPHFLSRHRRLCNQVHTKGRCRTPVKIPLVRLRNH